jgi:WD40 repeat protein
MAWSPDATRLAVGSSVGVYVLDATTLEVLQRLPANGPVYLVRYSPDGRTLVGGGVRPAEQAGSGGTEGGDLGVAWVWDTDSGTLRATLPVNFWLNDLAVDASGTLLAVGGLFPTTQAQVWDLTTNAALFTAAPGTSGETIGTSVAFSPDGQSLALAGGGAGVVLYAARTGELRSTLPGLAGPSYDLAFSADGRWLAAGSTQQAAVWDVPGKTLARTLPAEGEVWHVAFSPDGAQLALASGSAVQVVETATGNVVRSLPTSSLVLNVAFGVGTPNAVLRAVDIGQAYAWDAGSGAALATAGSPLSGFTGPVQGLAFLPDGALLSSELDTLRVWDVAGQASARAWPVPAQGRPALSPDGRQVASGFCDVPPAEASADNAAPCSANRVGVWDTASGALVRSLTVHTNTVNAVAYSPDGRWLASAGNDGLVALWDTAQGSLAYTLTLHTAAVAAVAFTPDSQTLASGGYDGQVILWDVATPTELGQAGTPRSQLRIGTDAAPVYTLAFSPDGTLLATGSAAPDSQVRLWRIADGAADPNPLAELAGHLGDIRALAFHPSGQWLVSGGAPAPTGPDDETVRVWSVTSTGGALAQSLRPHVGAVFALAFSADGRTLAAGGADGVVAVWDVSAGE